MKPESIWVVILVLISACQAQKPNSEPKPSTPAPSLGFNKAKDISPILDSGYDMYVDND
jgi:hypothetical protein